ncbi:hypothetical protein X744_29675 [Mesorhizobium sp. LNJC372A00]|nr:hypothetical protein X744_29675 [Mesorhizobium sp. LNJC372A00]
MRFIAAKSAEKQSQAMFFKTREAQQAQTINALRGHLAEHGVIAPQGIQNIGQWPRPSTIRKQPFRRLSSNSAESFSIILQHWMTALPR